MRTYKKIIFFDGRRLLLSIFSRLLFRWMSR